MVLVGDVVGYVIKSFGEGIYFVVKSGWMCVEVIVEIFNNGVFIFIEKQIKLIYFKCWDCKYGVIYVVFDILQ